MKNPIEEALERRNTADFNCFQALRQLIDNCDPEVLKDMVADYNGGEEDFAQEIVDEIKESLQERADTNNEFLSALRDAQIKPTLVKADSPSPSEEEREKNIHLSHCTSDACKYGEPDCPVVEREEPLERIWTVNVCRTANAFRTMKVIAKTEQEAIHKAIDEAGGEEFGSGEADYSAPDGAY